MEHVLASDQEADVSTRGQCETLVNLQLANHARLYIVVLDKVALKLIVCGNLRTIKIFFWCGVVLCFHICDPWQSHLWSKVCRWLLVRRCGYLTACRPKELLERLKHRSTGKTFY